ncbi:MAG: ribosome-associated translation inhibitor RaiA [Bacteroidota bacterium]
MKVTIQSIHFTATEKLQAYIEKKLGKLEQFYNRIVDAEVYLKLDNPDGKENKLVEIKVNVPGNTLMASDQAATFEAATDTCVSKLKHQLEKHKEKNRAY